MLSSVGQPTVEWSVETNCGESWDNFCKSVSHNSTHPHPVMSGGVSAWRNLWPRDRQTTGRRERTNSPCGGAASTRGLSPFVRHKWTFCSFLSLLSCNNTSPCSFRCPRPDRFVWERKVTLSCWAVQNHVSWGSWGSPCHRCRWGTWKEFRGGRKWVGHVRVCCSQKGSKVSDVFSVERHSGVASGPSLVSRAELKVGWTLQPREAQVVQDVVRTGLWCHLDTIQVTFFTKVQ